MQRKMCDEPGGHFPHGGHEGRGWCTGQAAPMARADLATQVLAFC
jgi:hypothetical protein